MTKGIMDKIKIRYFLYGIIIFLVLFFLILIMNRPAPITQGTCIAECYTYVTVEEFADEYHADDVCLPDCYIESMVYNPETHKKDITCICCACVSSMGSDLGECNYGFFLLDWVGNRLGLCQIPGYE